LIFFLKWPEKTTLSFDGIPIFSLEDLILPFNAFVTILQSTEMGCILKWLGFWLALRQKALFA